MMRYYAREYHGVVCIEDVEAPEDVFPMYARPQYTLQEAKMVAHWLNYPKPAYTASERLYIAIANYYQQHDKEPCSVKLSSWFYCKVLLTVPGKNWIEVRGDMGEPHFMGVPLTTDGTLPIDYELIA